MVCSGAFYAPQSGLRWFRLVYDRVGDLAVVKGRGAAIDAIALPLSQSGRAWVAIGLV